VTRLRHHKVEKTIDAQGVAGYDEQNIAGEYSGYA